MNRPHALASPAPRRGSPALRIKRKLRQAADELRLYRRCLEETSDGVVIADPQGFIIKANQSFVKASELSLGEILGRHLGEFVTPAERFQGEIWPRILSQGEWSGEFNYRRKSDHEYTAELSLTSVKNKHDRVIAAIAIFRDVTLRKRYERKLLQLANHDALTGLYNRRRFQEELQRELSKAKRQPSCFALLWLNLDQFKEVNDSLGHQAGDDLLVELSNALSDLLRKDDLAARIGGDEFAILMSNTDRSQAEKAAERIINGIRSLKLIVDDRPVRVTTSIGIALYPDHGANGQELLAHADMALYQSKDLGRNKFRTFAPKLNTGADKNSNIEWARQLREAIEKDRFVLHGQPIVDVRTNAVTHYELLVRMIDEAGNLVLPNNFIPIAERSGIIQDLDRWVATHAIKLLAQAARTGREERLAINLSASAFSDDGIAKLIKSELVAHQVDPSLLIIEITESSAMADIHNAKQFLRSLKQFGCQIALDDFGVGFSSFSHLKHLETDYIKLDGSFIRDLLNDATDRCIVEATIKIARQLGKRTVAEWVENQETLDLLRRLGVGFAQGYHIGKPDIYPPAPA